MIDFLAGVNFKTLMWIIPFVFFLHEMEEWNILTWYHATKEYKAFLSNMAFYHFHMGIFIICASVYHSRKTYHGRNRNIPCCIYNL